MKKVLIDDQQLKFSVLSLCREITLSGWSPDYIVGLTRGGLIPAVMISHYFNVPMHTLNVSLRDSGERESNCWMAEDAFGYDSDPNTSIKCNAFLKKKILIVDDINDTGATLNWIKDDWRKSCLPDAIDWDYVWGNNVRVAVLYDNESSSCTVPISYSAVDINKAVEDMWIDFPWEEWWKK